MARSPNPFTTAISSASSVASSITNKAGGALNGINFAEEKAALNSLTDRLSGGIGTAFNGATAGLQNIGTALNGAGNPIQSISNIASGIGQGINSAGIGGALGALGGIASAVSSAAGQLNNVLSLFRGQNLPAGGQPFQARGEVTPLSSSPAGDWRVKVNANFGLFGNAFGRLAATNGFVWPYTPKVTISTKANYSQIDPVHSNYPFQAYKSSQVDDITISGEFSCETETDASYWIAGTTFFKTATKMFFGASNYAGNPPVICELSGYGPGVFNRIPVVIKSFSVDLPDEVNYIKCSSSNFDTTWVPVLSTISVTLTPIYNRTKLRQFSLQEYANGNMTGYI
jgi:hypothetical protein